MNFMRCSLDNPSIGDEAGRFVDIFVKAVESHRFENLKMLYLGRTFFVWLIRNRVWFKELL